MTFNTARKVEAGGFICLWSFPCRRRGRPFLYFDAVLESSAAVLKIFFASPLPSDRAVIPADGPTRPNICQRRMGSYDSRRNRLGEQTEESAHADCDQAIHRSCLATQSMMGSLTMFTADPRKVQSHALRGQKVVDTRRALPIRKQKNRLSPGILRTSMTYVFVTQ
jgi:hypothetical protein